MRLGRGLNIEVVAEGIEQQSQADALLQLRCPFGQGWYLSVDFPAEGLAEFGHAPAESAGPCAGEGREAAAPPPARSARPVARRALVGRGFTLRGHTGGSR